MRVYTIKDIAQKAGVGISTVSRVLNNRPDVSAITRQRVMDVVRLYNYTQNANAKNLKQRDTNLVSLIVRGRQNTFLSSLAEDIIEAGDRQGQHFLLDFVDEAGGELEAAKRHIAERKVKGCIFLGSNIVGHSATIEALHLPCVFTTVDTGGLGLEAVSSVSVDNRASARMAIDHLLARGHRRIAVFGGIRDIDDSIGQRYQGVVQAFAARGLPFDEARYVQCSFDMEKAHRAALRFLTETRDFTAIFAMGDIMAIGIIRALADCGLSVPEDVSVIGFDGIALSRFMLPALTTIAQPARALAETSVSLMLRLLADPADRENVILKSTLLEGGSVRPVSA